MNRAGARAPSLRDKKSSTELAPHVLIHIALDGTTTIICHRSEMGQGIRGSMSLLIGDEIGADPSRVVVRKRRRQEVRRPEHRWLLEHSQAVTTSIASGRRHPHVADRGRGEAVEGQAGDLHHREHFVIHTPTKRTLPFADVVADAAKLPVPKKGIVLGRSRAEAHGPAEPAAPRRHGYSPARRSSVRMSASGHGIRGDREAARRRRTLVKYDPAPALAVAGVKKLVDMPVPRKPWLFQPWGGVAVIADNTWAAIKGRAALAVTWDHGANASYNSPAYREALLASVRAPGTKHRDLGDVDAAFAKAATSVEAEYFVPHLCQMPMEPLVAVARFVDGRAEVWAPTQNPQQNRTDVAKLLGLSEAKVTINVTMLGGGFGRKSKSDFVVEAAYLAKQLGDGRAVRVQWTREDDLKHGYYNAANAQRLRAGLDAKGQVTAWLHRTALSPIGSTFDAKIDTASADDMQQGVTDVALAAPNVRAEACRAPAHVRVGWYRSVYNIFHPSGSARSSTRSRTRVAQIRGRSGSTSSARAQAFARRLGIPKLPNYGESSTSTPSTPAACARHRARDRDSGWANRKGRAFGLAAHRSFVAYTAVVVSVVPDPVRVFRVEDAWISMDAGIASARTACTRSSRAASSWHQHARYGGVTMTTVPPIRQLPRCEGRADARCAAPIHTDLVASNEPPTVSASHRCHRSRRARERAFRADGKRLREMPLEKALRPAR